MITIDRFCLNRKAAPKLTLNDTLNMLSEMGITNIEVKNDLNELPDNKDILDGIDGEKVSKMLSEDNVEVETINAIGNMDLRSNIDENLSSLTEMLELTKNINLHNIIFCPVRSVSDNRSSEKVSEEAVANVKEYANLLSQYNVGGLIEPLGFTDSSLRFPWEAQDIIEDAGIDNFKLVADTFHYYLANIGDNEFSDKVDASFIGLVHLSSVLTDKPRELMDDQDRYMLSELDVMNSVHMAHMIEKSGYQGLYSFEPFSDDLKQFSKNRIQEDFSNSIKLVQNEIE